MPERRKSGLVRKMFTWDTHEIHITDDGVVFRCGLYVASADGVWGTSFTREQEATCELCAAMS